VRASFIQRVVLQMKEDVLTKQF